MSSAAPPGAARQVYQREECIVRVDAEDLVFDLAACATQAAIFAGIKQARQRGHGAKEGNPDLVLSQFPGGANLMKNVLKYMEANAAEERAAAAVAGELGVPAGVLKVDANAFRLAYDSSTVCDYLEAAAILRCSRLMRDTVLAPAAKELPSRRVLTLLERVMVLTVHEEALGTDGSADAKTPTPKSNGAEEAVVSDSEDDEPTSSAEVMQAFCQVIQRLCARLDAVDFKLTSALAAGTPWASLEVLRAHRVKLENLGRMNYALQSVTSTFSSFFYEEEKDKTTPKQEWKEHHFALHVYRKHIIELSLSSKDPRLKAIAEAAMEEQQESATWSDDEGDSSMQKDLIDQDHENDVPEAICDGAEDAMLSGLAGFVQYCDPLQTPPVLAAAMVRSLLLVNEVTRARTLFEAVFVRSRKAQAMVVSSAIPVDFLCAVKVHRVASVVLRRLLARYEELGRAELCHLLDRVLLEDFRAEKHCQDLVLNNELVQDITVYCRVSTRAVASQLSGGSRLRPQINGGASGSESGSATVQGTSGDADLLRLRKVGEKLFAAVFVLHNGFLPLKEEPERRGEPLAWQAAECPWDSGDLDLPLLQHVPDSGDALHLSRRVLLRGLFRRQHAGVENSVPTTVRLWALGRWPTCRDASLISEAFRFVTNCWRDLLEAKAKARWSDVQDPQRAEQFLRDEETLFQMFSDLEFWRLQLAELLSPWVPPQLLACHVAAKCQRLDEQQKSLLEENRCNLEEINRLRQTVSQLHAKLEVVNSRSVQSMQKQQEVSESLRALR